MANWPVDNFDDEGAADYLAELVNQFAETIDEILASDERSALDEEGEAVLMPNVELMALLCERYNAPPPKPRKVRQWQKKYLAIFDSQIGGLQPKPGYQEQRRKAIEKTFHWLESIAESYHAR